MNTLILTITLTCILLAIVMIAMGVKVFFTKGGRFPDSHVCRHDFDRAVKKEK